MHTSKNEIAPNIFRLTVAPSEHFEFSQFLLVDDEPCLIHAGKSSLYEYLKPLVQGILGNRKLKYIVFSHVEADESGACNKWLEEYSAATVVCNKVASISLDDSLIRSGRILKDGESIELGEMKLRMIETPHFPHNWDAHMWFEEKNRVLFSSDFLCQGGICEPVVDRDISDSVIKFYDKGGFIPYGTSTNSSLEKIDQLPFTCIAPMHGSVFSAEISRVVFDRVKEDLMSRSHHNL